MGSRNPLGHQGISNLSSGGILSGGVKPRNNPNPVQANPVNLPVNQNVPFITPGVELKKGVPPSISRLNTLAEVFDINVGGSLVQAATQFAQQKREQEMNRQQYMGMAEATQRASKTRDLLADLSKNGSIPASKNPYYQMGYQANLASELASEYRLKLYQARTGNPLANPDELADEIKQPYLEQIRGFRPDIAHEWFVKQAQAVDSDDIKRWEAEQSKQFIVEQKRTAGASLFNTIQVSNQDLEKGLIDVDGMQNQVAVQANSTLQHLAAVGAPTDGPLKAMVELIVEQAKIQPGGLKAKKAMLDSIKKITLPKSGAKLMATEYSGVYVKALEEITQMATQEAKAVQAEADAELQTNTQARINQMAQDFATGQGANKDTYLKSQGKPFDPEKVSAAYSSFSSGLSTLDEQAEENALEKVNMAITKGLEPNEILGMAIDLGLSAEQANKLWEKARSSKKARLQDSLPRNWDSSLVKEITSLITIPNVNGSIARWAGYAGSDSNGTSKILDKKLQSKYNRLMIKDGDYWSQHFKDTHGRDPSPAEVRGFINTLEDRYLDRIRYDIQLIQNMGGAEGHHAINQKNLDDILEITANYPDRRYLPKKG